MTLEFCLQKFFELKEFKPIQKEIIQWTLKRNNSLVIMPTGWGKSLCYQIPALMQDKGITLVVSPLIALMKDQVDKLKQKQIPAAALHSALSGKERTKILKHITQDRYRLLYVTPERFQKENFINSITKQHISLMAVDEAHCISQWGHDFRPDYSRLGEIRKKLGTPVTMALTATVSQNTQKDILKNLNLPAETKAFKQSTYRPNLYFAVQHTVGMENKISVLNNLLTKHQPAIIYFSLIHTLEKAAQYIRNFRIPFVKYHSQLTPKTRNQNQSNFLNGSSPVIMATPAFGLGIDKKNIRLVVHFEIPTSLESYYQEAGRAGRDDKTSFCYLLYDEDDLSIGMDFIKWSNPSLSFIQRVFWIIQNHSDAVRSKGLDHIREQLNFYNRRDFRVETAVNLLKRWNYITETRQGFEILDNPENWPPLKLLEQKEKHQLIHLKQMWEFAKSTRCRKQIMGEYFGEPDIPPCHSCDNCHLF
ncbi:MAG: ATP-dependent DNA helicase RecQ [Oligoflexia bacterium]|nr:ATP-dependent DNA helicase RecQ [Oligoflexia bacterium]